MNDKNECWMCNHTEPKAFVAKCVEHDTCDICNTKRADIKGRTAWGTRTGFTCDRCMQDLWAGRIALFTDEDFGESSFSYRDDIKCPYCGHEYYPDDLYEDQETSCPNCNSDMEVEVEWAASYSISKSKE